MAHYRPRSPAADELREAMTRRLDTQRLSLRQVLARMVVRGKLTAIEAARLQAGEDDERTKQRLAEDKQ